MSEPGHIRVSFSYVADDLGPLFRFGTQANPERQDRPKGRKLGCNFLLWFVVLSVAVVIYIASAQQPPPGTVTIQIPLWMPWTIVVLLVALALCIYLIVVLLKGVRGKFVAATGDELQTVDLSEAGVEWTTPYSSTHFDWKHFKRFEELPHAFHLISRAEAVSILPKRLQTPEELEQLRALLLQFIPPLQAGVTTL